jgi:hypothetical protein
MRSRYFQLVVAFRESIAAAHFFPDESKCGGGEIVILPPAPALHSHDVGLQSRLCAKTLVRLTLGSVL